MNIEMVSEVYQKLNKNNLHLLEQIYHKDVVFEDSAHRLEGWDQLSAYFDSLYTNVIKCDFDIRHHQQVEDSGFLTWTMQLQHPKLNGGEAVKVNGVSHIRFSGDRVIFHRDYFDLGEMLYENIPLLGFVIKNIKQRLGK
ncbi:MULTISPECIES: nuclear transport factor 2 family protein [Vibrio]|jgi:limonene-1,2-epoxide hydrolase|uniref:Nuclear transport factor 2 family protein n=1 Tax=Vibrio mediterranei TaxID=689 RepID=A0A3G4VCJ6_9VIBR|nr:MULTISPECIES: nuclear transport factor 2 family protein [Vibrio]AYV22424.1 nuclear transport factor 2 family protein [Vibrio mediterranei]EDL52114.1 putative transcriptional regulator [Vibrio mediterranei AK1]MCF4174617.1 nuclear transport factor 2 family protein [Vibrio sp. McD22-P3]MCY9854004.1 nuclear transport factor 2 family protein [Vibrio mediterranei]MDA0108263.1 nuclear transport factor 2 family protein [Vibrio sp. La 4.2.2]